VVRTRIGYLIDTHVGEYGQPVPTPGEAADAMDALVEEGIAAERAGFHSLQVPDRHGRTECLMPGALQLLTLLARETSKVALGSFALVSTLYEPMLVAEQAAIIDNLSRGRLYLTVARGYHEGYWDYFGVDRERMLGRFLEGLRVLELANGAERFSFDGEFFQVRDALLSPQPYQRPHYPLWGGGQQTAAIARCATYATCWTCDDFPIERRTWEEQAGGYRAAAIEQGKVPFVVLMRNGWVADSFEEATKEFGHHYVDEMRFYCDQGILSHHPDFDAPSKITPATTRDHVVVGSASQCIERLEYYEEVLGVDYVTMRFRMPKGPSFERVKDQIARFGEEVVSHFTKKSPAPLVHPAIPAAVRF
jgi:alkanesulfonate monooxygenase SsuD/methylene tetrahydromethanopterin reductase-like flavin-dependent oxidoreductase (luciferase family)